MIGLLIGLFGFALGILINYFADILPFKRSLGKPICNQCGEPLPLFDFLLTRQCSSCGKRKIYRYWIVLAATEFLTLYAWFYPIRTNFWIAVWLIVFAGTITIIDMEFRVVLHEVSLVSAGINLIAGIFLHGVIRTLIGGAIGFAVMWLLYYLGLLIVRLRMKNKASSSVDEALGFGDVNLSGVLGLLLGWPGIVAGLFIAILLAGLISLIYILYMIIKHRYESTLAIPYAPFLVLGAMILLLLPIR